METLTIVWIDEGEFMKLDRLLSITMMLINNDIVSAKDLADKFEVSIRTVYRDIDVLGVAGIPVVSYQGIMVALVLWKASR